MKLPQRKVKPKEGEKLVRVTPGFRSAWAYRYNQPGILPLQKLKLPLKKGYSFLGY